jgi:hypothetical protein
VFSAITLARHVAVLIAACSGVVGTTGHDQTAASSDVHRARKATTAFHDLGVAKKAGYGLLVDAKGIACIDNPGTGGMGVHFANKTLVGAPTLDVTKPEVLVYAPTRKGGLKLVALEYIVFQADWDKTHDAPPTLYGRHFHLTPAGNRYGLPAFYELHAWIWKDNPRGLFDDWNPKVSCAASTEHYAAAATGS